MKFEEQEKNQVGRADQRIDERGIKIIVKCSGYSKHEKRYGNLVKAQCDNCILVNLSLSQPFSKSNPWYQFFIGLEKSIPFYPTLCLQWVLKSQIRKVKKLLFHSWFKCLESSTIVRFLWTFRYTKSICIYIQTHTNIHLIAYVILGGFLSLSPDPPFQLRCSHLHNIADRMTTTEYEPNLFQIHIDNLGSMAEGTGVHKRTVYIYGNSRCHSRSLKNPPKKEQTKKKTKKNTKRYETL